MSITLWIINGALALLFMVAGLGKVRATRESLLPKMAWVENATTGQIRLIGAAEVLGALGLILPRALHIAEILTPLAAVGLTITMIGATWTHLRRKEPVVISAVLGLLSLVSAVLGFLVVL